MASRRPAGDPFDDSFEEALLGPAPVPESDLSHAALLNDIELAFTPARPQHQPQQPQQQQAPRPAPEPRQETQQPVRANSAAWYSGVGGTGALGRSRGSPTRLRSGDYLLPLDEDDLELGALVRPPGVPTTQASRASLVRWIGGNESRRAENDGVPLLWTQPRRQYDPRDPLDDDVPIAMIVGDTNAAAKSRQRGPLSPSPSPTSPVARTSRAMQPPTYEDSVDDARLAEVRQRKDLAPRKVVEVSELPLDTLSKVGGVNDFKPVYLSSLETAVATLVLFNAISTMMIIATAVERQVPQADRTAFGSQTLFGTVMALVKYLPLLFFAIVVLIVNNGFAEKAFYSCLKRNVILDFPASSTPAFMSKSPIAVAGIVLLVVYLLLAVVSFGVYGADFGAIVIFGNNLAVGVGLSWYRQQSIESKFISLSDFVQAFPDREGEFGNIDEHSLFWAGEFLRRATLAEAAKPSYWGSMRRLVWRWRGIPGTRQALVHTATFGAVFGLAGLCLAYFMVQSDRDAERVWTSALDPCVAACVASGERLLSDTTSAASSSCNATNASSTTPPFGTTDAPQRLPTTACHECTCQCIRALAHVPSIVLPTCTAFSRTHDACGGAQACPDTCP